jgi:maleamate amidohydrolase
MAAVDPAPWASSVPAGDAELYHRAGFGRSAGLGLRPALLVIDVQYRTVGHERLPIEAAMNEYPTACGERGWSAIDQLSPVLSTARKYRTPVMFPHVAPKTTATAGGFRGKSPTLASSTLEAYDFVSEAAPLPDEVLIPKDHPSAFFGTPLVTHLIERGIDTVLLAGCTTSGCVRATAVDAFSLGFKVGVIHDAVYDRTDLVHHVSLFDLSSKYADLLSADEARDYLSTTRSAA